MALYKKYSPAAIQRGANELDMSERTKKIVAAYCELSTEFKHATWEEVADKLGMEKNRSSRASIVGSLSLAAQAYQTLMATTGTHYEVREPESDVSE